MLTRFKPEQQGDMAYQLGRGEAGLCKTELIYGGRSRPRSGAWLLGRIPIDRRYGIHRNRR